MERQLTHFDRNGSAVMVDVSAKADSQRTATAKGRIQVSAAVFEAIKSGNAQKGDVLGVARVAGIMAAKRTSELIPLCHPLMLTKVSIDFELDADKCAVYAICTVSVTGKTGVEMEALTGVSVALLTIYDMCKALDKAMVIGQIHLVEKYGGKSGAYKADSLQEPRADKRD